MPVEETHNKVKQPMPIKQDVQIESNKTNNATSNAT